MFKVWQDFLNNPQVFISSCAAVISVFALLLQFIIFRLNGSRIKVNMSLVFYEPDVGRFFNYPVFSKEKDIFSDPGIRHLRTGSIRLEVNNASGIELLKVTITNCGRFPAQITDISFGYAVHGKEYKHFFSKYTVGLFPFVFSANDSNCSFPKKLEGGDEFSLYYSYWDAFLDLEENSSKSVLRIRPYVKVAGRHRDKKSKNSFKLNSLQSSTFRFSDKQIPLRIVLARYFYNNQSNQNRLKKTDNYFFSYDGNFGYVSILLESYISGQWPNAYDDQVRLVKKFCEECRLLFGRYYNGSVPDYRYDPNSRELREELASAISISLPMYIEKWKNRIDWQNIACPELYNKQSERQ